LGKLLLSTNDIITAELQTLQLFRKDNIVEDCIHTFGAVPSIQDKHENIALKIACVVQK
jgi:hypothetical protein